MSPDEPGYLALYRSGELERRVARLEARLAECDICPRECRADRLAGKTGSCHSGALPIVASVGAHHGEEPVISGSRGSGTVFFGNCNLRCVYCQNYQISQQPKVQRHNAITTSELARRLIYLQDELGCHNINLVTPSHFAPHIARAVLEAVPLGLKVPLVYNTSSYDSVATLQELDGVVDIYLADLRYADDGLARRYSRVRHYVESSRAAIREMQRQVGDLQVDDGGVARRGLIIRHLILPEDIAGSRESLTWLVNEVSPRVAVSVMSQYYPAHKARKYQGLNRKITPEEYAAVAALVEELGIENGWMQGMAAADSYRPDFNAAEPFKEGRHKKRERRKRKERRK